MNESSNISAAKGKLGILMPGMGAVATTVIAGVEAIKAGLGSPIGSLTQMGTIRLGKRTEARSPLINEFVPLAQLDDLVFGGWDGSLKNDVWALDLKTLAWTLLNTTGTKPIARFAHSSVLSNGKMVVFGGSGGPL